MYMPELPWRKFHYNDWSGDKKLGRCSTSTRGIWIDAVCTMMADQTDRISGTDEELSKDCRCSVLEIQAAHDDLKKHDAADVSMQNGCKTWVCRRLSRELSLSKIRANSASKRWSKTDANSMQHPMQDANASSVSVSVSASVSVPEGESEGKHFPEAETPSWEEFWKYCQLIGLATEWYARDKWLAAQSDHWNKKSNWQAYASRCLGWWRGDGAPQIKQVKNGVLVRIFPDAAIKQIDQMIAEHPCNPQSLSHGSVPITTELRAGYANLKQRRTELQNQIAGIPR